MGRPPRSVLSSRAVGVREEATEALDHLTAAVLHGATDVGERSRRAGATARDRAASAVLALRGQRPPQPWPWLVAGLAIGVVAGAVAGAVLARRRPTPAGDADMGVSGGDVGVGGGEPDRPVGES
jgi:hypothetical protein